MTKEEETLRRELRKAVQKARKAGLADDRVSLAIAGALVEVKADGYR